MHTACFSIVVLLPIAAPFLNFLVLDTAVTVGQPCYQFVQQSSCAHRVGGMHVSRRPDVLEEDVQVFARRAEMTRRVCRELFLWWSVLFVLVCCAVCMN